MTKYRILVCDDEPGVRALFERALSDYEVVSVSTGEEALEVLSRMQFHLVFMDLRLPGISGVKVVEEIRRLQPEAAVVLITGYLDDPGVAEAMQKGAHFLAKPFGAAQILALTQTLLPPESE